MTKKTVKKSILIVEDEPVLLKALARQFVLSGFDVRTAKQGEEGLSLAQHHRPDVILLDILMPVMDGTAMLRALKSSPLLRDIPVIVITNFSDTEKSNKYIEQGAVACIIKSNWHLKEIVSEVQKHL